MDGCVNTVNAGRALLNDPGGKMVSSLLHRPTSPRQQDIFQISVSSNLKVFLFFFYHKTSTLVHNHDLGSLLPHCGKAECRKKYMYRAAIHRD